MSFLRQIADGFSRWMDSVAAAAVAILGLLAAPRVVRLAEQANGSFMVQAKGNSSPSFAPIRISNGVAICSREAAAALKGSQVELVMRPEQFFFRALELPRRA